MKDTFKVEIKETLSRVIDVSAEMCRDPEDAIDIVRKAYDKGEYVLGSEDFVETEFSLLETPEDYPPTVNAPDFEG